jgi:predicted short-subunit dehydrogenase-like oxidoreductase (DUF2520 family)
LGTALARRLSEAGYKVCKIHSRRLVQLNQVRADVVWLCVPDAEIARVAQSISQFFRVRSYAFHSSGVLTSDVLISLRESGTAVASVHPLMTFVRASVPELAGVPFAIEGDPKAARLARKIVRDLGGKAFAIGKKEKVAYHAFATIICPLLVSLLATAEKTAALAGMSEREARRRMMPIVRQTLRNYERLGPAGAFSGPIVRGDAETIRAHLHSLRRKPTAKKAYTALARAALDYLPNRSRQSIEKLLTAEGAEKRR